MTYEEKYEELKKFINGTIIGELKADRQGFMKARKYDRDTILLITQLVGKINELDEK